MATSATTPTMRAGVLTTATTIPVQPRSVCWPVTMQMIPSVTSVAENTSALYSRSSFASSDAESNMSSVRRRSAGSLRPRNSRHATNDPAAKTITLKRAAHHSCDSTRCPNNRNGTDASGMTSEYVLFVRCPL